ncbi:MAG: serine protease [Pseudomonadota bacterium]
MDMTIADQLIHVTARIECVKADGRRSKGTAFFCNLCQRGHRSVPVLVTNKHVVAGGVAGVIQLHLKNDGGGPDYGHHITVPITSFEQKWVGHADDEIDLTVLPVAPLFKKIESQGLKPYYRGVSRQLMASEAKLAELTAVEDVLMIGYPSGLWDSTNNLPITRRGVTATPPYIDFQGRPEFVIDCACFPGSSGSPVFIFNQGSYSVKGKGLYAGDRLIFLGVLYAGPQYEATGEIRVVPVPTEDVTMTFSRLPINLGYCIKASALEYFEEHFDKVLQAEEEAEKADDVGTATLSAN